MRLSRPVFDMLWNRFVSGGAYGSDWLHCLVWRGAGMRPSRPGFGHLLRDRS